jgi:hypothetical protein
VAAVNNDGELAIDIRYNVRLGTYSLSILYVFHGMLSVTAVFRFQQCSGTKGSVTGALFAVHLPLKMLS